MRVGSDQAYASRIEAGQTNVTLETEEQIAVARHVDASDLLNRREDEAWGGEKRSRLVSRNLISEPR